MRKVTIGEVLRRERIHQGKKLSQLQKAVDIQVEYLEALENNDFDQLPSPFYARSFIKKYAWELGLDEKILLAAYENGSMVAYDEIEVDEEHGRTTRIERRKIKSYLPIFYFVLISLGILGSVGYFVWNYSTSHVSETPITTSSSSQEEKASEEAKQREQLDISVSMVNGVTYVTAAGASEPVELTISRSKETDTWVTVSETRAASGLALTANAPSFKEDLVTNYEFYIGLGDPNLVELTLNGQKVALENLPEEATTLVLRTSSAAAQSSPASSSTASSVTEEVSQDTEVGLPSEGLEE
ncbi:helix-turn-helix domain-containing protein [Streptococcus danieliae]|uniref:Helix-turn-helix domain-containing protein n=1 Tax=Streptococcus danieliae TaxID=747656 RepID=A0A7X3KBG8_9STRE|nr:helix-turn-helix domain-containing protein [Streptococcus danieliae]MCU0082211.1 helix-turn-helix domain-containing protein [Streptococcus danieliae]MVX58164.1 helix-turn-helix domain-containing protein [Streptococcus danieliae]